ncbi:hypothetical protein BESB_071040 [Besnoitia besnoiti]|uniref:Transmembrane protein n=1 Tax=Besnoitia besnoiti TaxID=94643 RepID=A0A2A9MEY7_BESBE|nr:uncharacterized protein BESB_071040 [Besnoitia besnoiti]PFH33952.1 hypothetical protein BESB_071040 [Besnoitia besnoiti]
MEDTSQVPATPEPLAKKAAWVRASQLGLRGFAIIYGIMCIYLLTQMPKEVTADGYKPAAMGWLTATTGVGLTGCIVGFIVTFESCKTSSLVSVTILAFTISFILSIISMFVVCFTYFSIFWIIFTGLHIFLSLMSSGAAYGTVTTLIKPAPVDERTPLTIDQVTGADAA